jgi:hypothetical protein
MANTFIKATQIAATGLGLLEREIVLPGLVWRNAVGDFAGAAGDTISIKVPARTVARTRTLRGARGAASEGTGIIDMDSLVETKVDVTLDTDVYSAIRSPMRSSRSTSPTSASRSSSRRFGRSPRASRTRWPRR